MSRPTLAPALLRSAIAVLAAALFAHPASAQIGIPDINGPKRAAQKAADAENARLSAQTGQALPTRTGPGAPPAPAPSRVVGGRAPAAQAAMTPGASPGGMQPVTREIFSYEAAGRRDPYFSLILTEDLRPLLSDLKLVGILYDGTGRRSVAIMRDILTNVQYRVGTGMTLGRMRVAQIKPRGVIFTIDEFGLSRQDSLMMASDSTKVR